MTKPPPQQPLNPNRPPGARPIYAMNDAGESICGAWGRQKQKPCEDRAVMPNGRCRRHGGKSTGPIKHGRTARAFQGRLGLLVQKAAEEGPLADLEEPLLVMEGVMHRKGELLAERDSVEFRETALDLAQRLAEEPDNGILLTSLLAHLEAGCDELHALESIDASAITLQKGIESVKKLELARQQSIPLRSLAALLSLMTDDVVKYCDPATAKKIAFAWDKRLRLSESVPAQTAWREPRTVEVLDAGTAA